MQVHGCRVQATGQAYDDLIALRPYLNVLDLTVFQSNSILSQPNAPRTAWEGLLLQHLARIFTPENNIYARQLDCWWLDDLVGAHAGRVLWPHTYPKAADVKRQGGWTEGLLLSNEAVAYVKSLPLHDPALLLKIVSSSFKYDKATNRHHN
jgi:hypothetical protein